MIKKFNPWHIDRYSSWRDIINAMEKKANKKMTIEDLAEMISDLSRTVVDGFLRIDKRFDAIDKRFDRL